MFTGLLTYNGHGDLSGSTVCFIALWDAADTTNGFPDPTKGDAIGQASVTCPTTVGISVIYEADILVTGTTSAGIYAGMDLDGDSGTTNDLSAGGYYANPFSVTAGSTYTDIDVATY
jgi:hypothetical protein